MDNTTKSTLVKTLQKEFVRRKLVQYFESKGYTNFLVKPYPPTLMDMVDRIDILEGIVEVEHALDDINMQSNAVTVAWNLFVLGNQRANLGNTTHDSLMEIETAANSIIPYDGPINIKQIIEWMVETIGNSTKLTEIYDHHAKKPQDRVTSLSNMAKPNKTIPNFKRTV